MIPAPDNQPQAVPPAPNPHPEDVVESTPEAQEYRSDWNADETQPKADTPKTPAIP